MSDVIPQVTRSYDTVAQKVLSESMWPHKARLNPKETAEMSSALARARGASEAELLEKLRQAQLRTDMYDVPDIFAAAREYIDRRKSRP